MSVVRIDPSKVLRPVPPIRGAMTEWMTARPGPAKGTERGYGQMLAVEEEDIALAARAGINAIRCAVEHHALEEVERPGVYKEDGFARVKQMLDWYGRCDIGGILDLHNAIGRDGGGDWRLWQHKEFQDRFVNVWRELVRRFRGHPQVIAYEPLNEAEPRHTDDWSERYRVWNDLAKRVTAAIRELDADKPIIINSIEYAHPKAFAGLEHTGDPNTVYSFHWYWPYAFHLQKRPWHKDQNVYHYPGTYDGKWWDRNTMREELEPVMQFANRHKVPLFCGEFGCVSECPEMEDMLWLLDLVSLMDQLGVTWTYYHYMFRTTEPYWMNHFDCNMFIYEANNNRLRPFDRKVSLLSDLMRLSGSVLDHAQPDDASLMVYAVLLPSGQLRVYASNKSPDTAKTATLELGGRWAPVVGVRRMARGTGGYQDAPAVTVQNGKLELTLEPLSIARLTVQPANGF